MEKSFIENWQESSKSLAGLFKNIGDKNVAMSRELCNNLASKQWAKMMQASLVWTREIGNGPEADLMDLTRRSLPVASEDEMRAFRELVEIYQAAFEKVCDSQVSLSKSYFDLLSDYAENLQKSRDIDDLVASNFDYLSNVMMMTKSGALDSLKVGESIKTALVAWSENSFH